MKVDFFEKELDRIQKRFNYYGALKVIDVKKFPKVVFGICNMGLIIREIAASKSRDRPHDEIALFMRIKNELNRIIDKIEMFIMEREGAKCEKMFLKKDWQETLKLNRLYASLEKRRCLEKSSARIAAGLLSRPADAFSARIADGVPAIRKEDLCQRQKQSVK